MRRVRDLILDPWVGIFLIALAIARYHDRLGLVMVGLSRLLGPLSDVLIP